MAAMVTPCGPPGAHDRLTEQIAGQDHETVLRRRRSERLPPSLPTEVGTTVRTCAQARTHRPRAPESAIGAQPRRTEGRDNTTSVRRRRPVHIEGARRREQYRG